MKRTNVAKATKQASGKARSGTQAFSAHVPVPTTSASHQVGPTKHSLRQPRAPAEVTPASSQLPSCRLTLKGTSWQGKTVKDHSKAGWGGTGMFVKATNQPSQHQAVRTEARQVSAWICSEQS